MYIKGFDKNLKCRDFQFEIGKTYDTGANEKDLELCTNKVFHFCENLKNVHEFYNCKEKYQNRFCEIEVLGKVIRDDKKLGSNKIRIKREIKGEELNFLKGLKNNNTGDFNTGDFNTGDYNTGDYNTGDYNTGNRNTGDFNTGDYNTGNRNTGDYNTGNRNTGDFNTGNRNTGDYNTGNRNTGDYNTGNRNTGDFNSCNYSTGFFNTKEKNIFIFNKESNMTYGDFINSKYYHALTYASFNLTQWIYYTEEEKKESLYRKALGGYLKQYSYKEACFDWWNRTPEKQRKIIMSIPNFDKNIFKEITGINVDDENL